MAIDPSRRDEINDAVTAYNNANPLTQLPRSAAQLLAVMFPTGDVCQHAFAAQTFGRKQLPTTAEFVSRQGLDTYRLHLPLVRR